MIDHRCQICENPCEESAFVCERCTTSVRRFLDDAQLAGEVETTVALQARYGTSVAPGSSRTPEPIPMDTPEAQRPSQAPETFAWAASRERPTRGALRPTRLPFNERAAERAAAAFNSLTTWARVVETDRGPIPPVPRGTHPAAWAARYLAEQLDWIRHQRFAAECLADLRSAGGAIRQIVDSPPGHRIAGPCTCGTTLYARNGTTHVTCPICGTAWNVEELREYMRATLRSYLVTAAEGAWLLAFFGITGNRNRSRKTIVMWAQRGRVTARGEVDGNPTYLFGDILDRATRTALDEATA